jgi:hypothetical protein
MNGHETALAELDRIGRHAAAALRSAVRNPDGAGTDRHIISAASASPVADAHDPEPIVPIHELELDLTAPDAGPGSAGPRRTRQRRLVLMAAAIAAVAGIGAVVTLRPPEPPEITAGGSGAPTAALGDGDGDGDGGIYPRDADHLGMTVASFDPSGDWQWTIDIPAAGHHLLFDLTDGSTTASYVMADLGSAPLQVATTDVDGQIGAGVVAVYGVVDARAVDLSSADDLVVEWSGADPVRLDVLAVDGATHNAFVGFVPRDVAADAQVIARTPTGEEIARVPLTSTGHTEEIAGDDAIFPEGADPATPVRSEKESPDGTYWAAAVLSGGHHVALMVGGNEDSITTVFDAPGSEPLQVLATLLDGVTAEGGRDVAIYGIVEAAAETVELVVPGSEPVALDLEPIDGATHDTFVGFVPPGVGDDAVVVARDARGDELARRPLAWTIHDAADTRR